MISNSGRLYSYIFKKLMGVRPREYMAANIFPELGINDNKIGWRKNSDGVHTNGWGMIMSAYDMAKLGQLYLQNGLSAPDTHLISSDWVNLSAKTFHVVGHGQRMGFPYWTIMNEADIGEIYCTGGTFSNILNPATDFAMQYICFEPEQERVYVEQTDGGGLEALPKFVAFERTTSYENKKSKKKIKKTKSSKKSK